MQIQLSDEQVEFIYKELSCSSGYNLQSIHYNGELQELVSYLSKRMEEITKVRAAKYETLSLRELARLCKVSDQEALLEWERRWEVTFPIMCGSSNVREGASDK